MSDNKAIPVSISTACYLGIDSAASAVGIAQASTAIVANIEMAGSISIKEIVGHLQTLEMVLNVQIDLTLAEPKISWIKQARTKFGAVVLTFIITQALTALSSGLKPEVLKIEHATQKFIQSLHQPKTTTEQSQPTEDPDVNPQRVTSLLKSK
jgi:hypothetical protein